MNIRLKYAKRILIIGDAGRGKTTLAKKISKQLHIQLYSTDDFHWKIKFSEKQEKQKSIENISEIYNYSEWIVEGTTYYLAQPGFEKADVILYLSFQNVLSQWWQLIKRHTKRKDEKIFDLIKLLRHVLYKKYGFGYKKHEPKIVDLLKPFTDKVIILYSHKQIDEFINE